MILLLTDETYRQMISALVATDAGRAVAERLAAEPELPDDRELVRLARQGADAPDAIAVAVRRRDAASEAAETTRAATNDLIRHVHGAGVPVSTIARWFSMDRRRIYEVPGLELTGSAAT